MRYNRRFLRWYTIITLQQKIAYTRKQALFRKKGYNVGIMTLCADKARKTELSRVFVLNFIHSLIWPRFAFFGAMPDSYQYFPYLVKAGLPLCASVRLCAPLYAPTMRHYARSLSALFSRGYNVSVYYSHQRIVPCVSCRVILFWHYSQMRLQRVKTIVYK